MTLFFHFALFEAILFSKKGSKPEKKLSKWAAKINFALDLPCRAIIGPILFYDFAWNVDSLGSQMTLYHPWLSEAAIRRSKFSGFFQWLFWVPMMVNKASMVKFWMCSAKNPSTGCQPVWRTSTDCNRALLYVCHFHKAEGKQWLFSLTSLPRASNWAPTRCVCVG